MKKLLFAVLSYFVITMLWAYPWHILWFHDLYQELGAITRDPPIIPLGIAAVVIQGRALCLQSTPRPRSWCVELLEKRLSQSIRCWYLQSRYRLSCRRLIGAPSLHRRQWCGSTLHSIQKPTPKVHQQT